jgi:hypothetical protein
MYALSVRRITCLDIMSRQIPRARQKNVHGFVRCLLITVYTNAAVVLGFNADNQAHGFQDQRLHILLRIYVRQSVLMSALPATRNVVKTARTVSVDDRASGTDPSTARSNVVVPGPLPARRWRFIRLA